MNSYTSNYLKFDTISVNSIWIKASDVIGAVYQLDSPISIVSLNSITIAVMQKSPIKLQTYIRDGIYWSLSGNEYNFGDTYLSYSQITRLNSTTISFGQNVYIGNIIWNGTDWSITGNYYDTSLTTNWINLTSLNSNTLAVVTKHNSYDRLYTLTKTGLDWSITGNYYTLPTSNITRNIDKFNSTTIVRLDYNIGKLNVYTWNGINWTITGNAYTNTSINFNRSKISVINSNTVVAFNGSVAAAFIWDGTNFTLSGSVFTASTNFPECTGIENLNSNIITLIDNSTGSLRMLYWSATSWENYSIAPKAIGELWINDLKFEFEQNPDNSGYKPKLNVKETTHELSDGGIVKYVFGKSFECGIDLEYQSQNMYDNFYNLYKEKNSFVFVPFPTGTAWEGKDLYEVNWIGDFNFLELFNNEWKNNRYNGNFDLRETSK
jgi:hypothetical protein